MLYKSIINRTAEGKAQLALLIDPDKHTGNTLKELIEIANNSNVSFFLVGGSIIFNPVDFVIDEIKKQSNIPVILFPGSLLQISDKADGILLLSLISGRNPEYLIGNHVIAAPMLKNSNLEIISTGYILIENSKTTSVEYMSNTKPIPANKPDIAVATAIAGEMLGNKTIYLEAGSGAEQTVNSTMIEQIKANINIPLIVGGGINSAHQAAETINAGADIIVIGTAAEKNPNFITEIGELF